MFKIYKNGKIILKDKLTLKVGQELLCYKQKDGSIIYKIKGKKCLHPPDERYYQPAEPENNVPEDYYCLKCGKQLPLPEPIEERLYI